MSVGVSASYWDRAGDSKPTKNFSGIFNYSQLTSLKISTTLTANVLKTSYVDGVVYGIRFDKDFMNGKMNWGVNYRFVDYNYLLSSGKLIEHIGGIDLSYQFTRKFSMSVNYERNLRKTEYIPPDLLQSDQAFLVHALITFPKFETFANNFSKVSNFSQ